MAKMLPMTTTAAAGQDPAGALRSKLADLITRKMGINTGFALPMPAAGLSMQQAAAQPGVPSQMNNARQGLLQRGLLGLPSTQVGAPQGLGQGAGL